MTEENEDMYNPVYRRTKDSSTVSMDKADVNVHRPAARPQRSQGWPENSPSINHVDEEDQPHTGILNDDGEEGCCCGYGCCGIFVIFLSVLGIIITFPITLFFCFRTVSQYERGVIMRLGKLQDKKKPKEPGMVFIIPCVDKFHIIDLRTITYDVPPQEILTKDSVTVQVDAVAFYRITNAIISIMNVEDVHSSTHLLAQTTLRNELGRKELASLLSEREEIANSIQSTLDRATDVWGVLVERVEVKDVRLPMNMQRAMAAEAEATRDAKAKIIAARGEQQASQALKEASDVMNESPFALQLRYLQTLNSISAEKNSTIIFPLPMELLRGFGAGSGETKSRKSSKPREVKPAVTE